MNMLSRLRSFLPIAAVLMLAAVLRFWGLRWGLPNALHSYSYHPDEFLTIGAAATILTGFFPRFYNYPSLYLYLAAFVILGASGYGLFHDTSALYLCARVVTALLGVGAVAAVYWAAKTWGERPSCTTTNRQGRAGNDRPRHVMDTHSPGQVAPNAVALLAALILCIAPLHVQHSHFATVDVPSTLFVALCLGFAGQVLSRGSWRDYLLCGVMAGLAAGTKYNAGLVVLCPIAAHFLGSRDRNAGLRRLLASLGAFVAAFIVSTPASIFRTRDFLYGLTYEMHHAAEGHGLVFAGTGNGFLFTFTSSLWYGLGPALEILFVAAAIYGIIRLDRRALVLLAFVVPYYALISLSQVRFARYALPLYPAAALLIAWMVVDLRSRSIARVREGGLRNKLPRIHSRVLFGLLGLSLAGTLLYTIAIDRLFVQTPPQDRAARWIFANIPKGSSIGVVDTPWFYSPPYTKTVGGGILQQRIVAEEEAPYALRGMTPLVGGARWWVMSDYEILDAIRLRRSAAGYGDWVDPILHKVDYVHANYSLSVAFSDRLSTLGISFGSTQSLPHDMRYPAPTIWIYERRKK